MALRGVGNDMQFISRARRAPIEVGAPPSARGGGGGGAPQGGRETSKGKAHLGVEKVEETRARRERINSLSSSSKYVA